MCVWVASACVYVAGVLSIEETRKWQEWWHEGGMEGKYKKKKRTKRKVDLKV